MALRLVVDHGKPLVQVEVSGLVVASEIFEHMNRLELENALAYPKLVDARRMQVGFSADDVMQFAAAISGLGAVEILGPLAVVATSDEATGVIRRYINLSKAQRPARPQNTPRRRAPSDRGASPSPWPRAHGPPTRPA